MATTWRSGSRPSPRPRARWGASNARESSSTDAPPGPPAPPTRRPGGPPVASDDLRQVPVSYLVRNAAALWWQTVSINEVTGEVSFADTRPTAKEVAKVRAAGPRDPEPQAFVARVYRLALILNEPPTAAVE